MTKTEIKKVFKDYDIQMGKGSIELIEHEIKHTVSRLACNCKDGNVKRLTPDVFWIALGREYKD